MFKFSKRVPADGTDAVGAILKAAADPKIISFAGGLPAPELFPVEGMKKQRIRFTLSMASKLCNTVLLRE